jgi:hypothetical protein
MAPSTVGVSEAAVIADRVPCGSRRRRRPVAHHADRVAARPARHRARRAQGTRLRCSPSPELEPQGDAQVAELEFFAYASL